jgi:hypothetical protein
MLKPDKLLYWRRFHCREMRIAALRSANCLGRAGGSLFHAAMTDIVHACRLMLYAASHCHLLRNNNRIRD